MNYEIVELTDLNGSKTTIYSVIEEGESLTLFDHFVNENLAIYRAEIKYLLNRIKVIASRTGARSEYFKLDEGTIGDGVSALYDDPDSNLRLYCIRYGAVAIILGGGGYKSKAISAYQEDPKLNQEANKMRLISQEIMKRLKEGEMRWSADGTQLSGNLIFSDEDYE